MVNQALFNTESAYQGLTLNAAGAPAYAFGPREALAQLVMTGTLHGTFYTSAQHQFAQVMNLALEVEPTYLAKLALYARAEGRKDTAALLVAVLGELEADLCEQVFQRVIDNGRMLRNYVQILRSNVLGRRSLGSRPKRLVREWISSRSPMALFRASVGAKPSLADVIRMVHPKPQDDERRALYGYLIGRQVDVTLLPDAIRHFEAFKAGEANEVPDVPFLFLTALDLDAQAWRDIATRATWQQTRMNLNTFERHGVFRDRRVLKLVTRRLKDRDEIRRAKAMPFELMAAWLHASPTLPRCLRRALEQAMEIAIENVPRFPGRVAVLPDVSGSMHWPMTGDRGGGTSKMRALDVAALLGAAIQRRNSSSFIVPFHHQVEPVEFSRRASVTKTAERLASLPTGGTDCAAPLRHMLANDMQADLVILVSDNQSWLGDGPQSGMQKAWKKYRARNPEAKLICLDIQPYPNTQVRDQKDVLNVGGFSDATFQVIDQFARGQLAGNYWADRIEATRLDN